MGELKRLGVAAAMAVSMLTPAWVGVWPRRSIFQRMYEMYAGRVMVVPAEILDEYDQALTVPQRVSANWFSQNGIRSLLFWGVPVIPGD